MQKQPLQCADSPPPLGYHAVRKKLRTKINQQQELFKNDKTRLL